MALYPGLDPQKAAKRHVRYAQALIDAGFEFELQTGRAGRDDVAGLMAESVAEAREDAGDPVAQAGFALNPQDSGIAVRSPDGELAGASVVAAVEFDERTALFLRGLGVAEAFRSRGIGTVLIGMTPQVLTQAGLPSRSRIVTRCPEVRATFFHRAAFTVEQPGAEVPDALARIGGELLPDFGPTACWAHMDVP